MSLEDRTVVVYFEFKWPISIFQSPEDKLQVSVSYRGKSISSVEANFALELKHGEIWDALKQILRRDFMLRNIHWFS